MFPGAGVFDDEYHLTKNVQKYCGKDGVASYKQLLEATSDAQIETIREGMTPKTRDYLGKRSDETYIPLKCGDLYGITASSFSESRNNQILKQRKCNIVASLIESTRENANT